MPQIFVLPRQLALDDDANPLAGALLYFFQTGTTTLQAVYADAALTTQHSNPVQADAAGEFPKIYLNSTAAVNYRIRLTTADGVQLYQEDDIDRFTVSQVEVAQALNPRTDAEIAAGVTPFSIYIPSNDTVDIVHATRHGFRSGATAAQNAAAIASAALVIQETNAFGGGIIQLPAGAFDVDAFLIPNRIRLRGMGAFATRLTNDDAGHFVTLGTLTATGVIKENCGIEDVFLENLHKDGHGILLMETRAASVRRVYHEGTTTSGRSNRFIVVDGGAISSYFNHIEDCVSNHVELLAMITASGIGNATSTFFKNVCGTGDKTTFPNSIGMRITTGQGSGTVWTHGNFEQFGTGWQQESGSQACTILGARFEGNTADIKYQATAGALSVIGSLLTSSTISNTANDGYDHLALIGCVDGTHSAVQARLPRGAHLLSAEVGNGTDSECPLLIEGYPGWTTDRMIKVVNSAGTEVASMSAEGQTMKQSFRSGGASPSGVITPRFVGDEFLDTTAAGTWYKATSLVNTGWVALN